MVAIYAFYADIFWLNSMLMNWAVLLIGTRFRKQAGWKSALRCLGAAALGSTIETALLVMVRSYRAMTIVSIVIVIPGMVWLVFEQRGRRLFPANLFLCLGVAVLLGGAMMVLDERTGIGRVPFLMALLGIFWAQLILQQLYGTVRLYQKIYPVELCSRGQRVRCNGLLDTGNMLRIPDSGQEVHIVENSIPARLGLKPQDILGMVSYQSLGCMDGKLPVYQIDSLEALHRNGGRQAQLSEMPAVIAQADPGLLDQKPYQVILHSDTLFEHGKGEEV